jgi:hypothetical protein
MTDSTPTDDLMQSLARAVACGRTVSAWARNTDVSPKVARRWSELPEFKPIVEQCRIRHAERLVGKAATRAERALDRISELAEHPGLPNVSLAAAKAVVEKWIALTEHFLQEKKYQELMGRVNALHERRAGGGFTGGGRARSG